MPKLPTDVDIFNISLGYLGEQKIGSPTENNREAKLFRLHFYQTVGEILEMRRWSKGRKRIRLTRDNKRPDFGYLWSFSLPSDCVRVLSVFELSDPSTDGTPDMNPVPVRLFDIEDDKLLTNPERIGIYYVGEGVISKLSPLLIKAISLSIAAKIAPALGESRMSDPLERKAYNAIQDAWMSDVQQSRSGENSDPEKRSRSENPQLQEREGGAF